ncbi:MAG TPA: hypothetical protein VNL91_03435 [Thermoanaerobaculia bacterium]|nr:hypothetical protein [Thermoanaerobaculia bacterium]
MLQRLLAALLLTALPATADDWSLGLAGGPFGFGRFAERTMIAETEAGTKRSEIHLSAATRPGLSADLQKRIGGRISARLEGTFTRSPVAVRGATGSGVALDAGRIAVTTFALPLVVHLRPGGALRFDLFAGPAYALYHVRRRRSGAGLALFEGTRSGWGTVAGAGMAWRWNDRFALEGRASDIATSSPMRRSDFPRNATGVRIPRPHNLHVTGGIRYSF